MSDFKTCKKCDFEWHLADGDICPVCKFRDKETVKDGGVFGTAKNQKRINLWMKAFGLVALIILLSQIF